jgi:hypothetical protein
MNAVIEANRLRIGTAEAGLPEGCAVQRTEIERRVIPLSRGHHVRGRHPIRKNHPAVPFESALECSLLSALAPLSCLVRIVSQPVTVFFSDQGTSRHYTPDFLVELRAVPEAFARLGFGLRTMVEVKPLQLALGQSKELCDRLRVLRVATGAPVSLITEVDIPLLCEESRHGA